MRTDHRRILGALGEHTAMLMLQEAGFHVCDRNWRDGARGEVDIVAEDSRGISVVEVRTRIGDAYGSALESIGAQKVAKLRKLAVAWAKAHEVHRRIRVDAIAITVPPGLREEVIAAPAGSDLRDFGVSIEWIQAIS